MTKSDKRFYTVVEAIETKGKTFRGKIYTFDEHFRCLNKNWVNVQFDDDNKGFEGLEHLRRGKEEYLLALCEGNKCRGGQQGRKTRRGEDKGFTKKW